MMVGSKKLNQIFFGTCYPDMMKHKYIFLGSLLLIFSTTLHVSADDGYRLWLKYEKITDAAILKSYSGVIKSISLQAPSSALNDNALKELKTGLHGLLGSSIPISAASRSKQIVLQLIPPGGVIDHEEGYRLSYDKKLIRIQATTDRGLLYGAFGLLRHLQMWLPLEQLDQTRAPKINLRILNHWDNPNGTIERGYAGSTLWKWADLPDCVDERYTDYARANASIGINGTVVNNVNASARFLDKEYLYKVAALAKLFRGYGIKTYLSIRFTAPNYLSGLKSADPLDPAVRQWWKDKVDEIYQIIPDFGGFLVKANSEGEPGPQDYNRTHADGANMLAEALAPHGGIVMWRAFVYKADPNNDRAAESYNEFKPLDGAFKANVMVQVKNGPIDFQPREPFHPLFGAMPQTPLMMEFQITQEYLGQSTHWVYLANLFKEVLESDTYARGPGSTVAKVIDGSLDHHQLTGIAGVANTGSDRNWCGHIGNQANWYSFGRLSWDPSLATTVIADEWIKMTLTHQPTAISMINDLMMKSHEACVDYMTPLGLHHIMGESIHFGPQPWLEKSRRADWTSAYYHRADSVGLGFDRTITGSNALGLYAKEIQQRWGDPDKIPLQYLLWFHHVAWDKQLPGGKTLWKTLCAHYYQGVSQATKALQQWQSLKPSSIDPEVYASIEGKLKRQQWEAEWWKDACLLYFQTYSKMDVPSQYPKIIRSLEELKELVRLYQMR